MPGPQRSFAGDFACLAMGALLAASSHAADSPTMKELFHAKYLKIPAREETVPQHVMRKNFRLFFTFAG